MFCGPILLSAHAYSGLILGHGHIVGHERIVGNGRFFRAESSDLSRMGVYTGMGVISV